MRYIPKVGDVITIRDGSHMYCEDSRGHRGKFASTNTIGWCKDEFVVKTINGVFPITMPRPERLHGDTRIQNLVNGENWFCIAEVSLNFIRHSKIAESILKFKKEKRFSL